MESYKIQNLSFKYPTSDDLAISDITLTITQGEFITLCGRSGCGKTTLLRHLKPQLAPHGDLSGEIYFEGRVLNSVNEREQISKIGYVMQNPESQIVTDKVWHELAFGLEGLGIKTPEIRTRVAEMASFFGIRDLFYKSTSELSGGQKQLMNLASVMVMQPSVLILDEPTSRLDPIAAQSFFDVLKKINRELGTTIILAEHRLEEAFAISDRVIVMDSGKVIADCPPNEIGGLMRDHDMFAALPTAIRVCTAVAPDTSSPVTVRDGRVWLADFAAKNPLCADNIPCSVCRTDSDVAVVLRDVWFRYEKNQPDVLRGISAEIRKGELYAIVGGNGTGKTTALSVIGKINKPYRGKVITNQNDKICTLPQEPQTLFTQSTVLRDLYAAASGNIEKSRIDDEISRIIYRCRLEGLTERHPYDLSGGEQQRAALAKVLLSKPDILLLDEPTKGFDAHFKKEFADILYDLKNDGITIIMVSHDIEFCAEYADYCAMLFDGAIVSEDLPREFFSGKSFYTTSANRMARTLLPQAVLADDIIVALSKEPPRKTEAKREPPVSNMPTYSNVRDKKKRPNLLLGTVFGILFLITVIFQLKLPEDADTSVIQLLSLLLAAFFITCLIPQKSIGKMLDHSAVGHLSWRTIAAILIVLFAAPLTIWAGIHYFGDRRYYLISILIILETALPFFIAFESRKPQARELVIISVLCAIAVVSRAAFSFLPQFKPIAAIVIISGVAFGGEAGFLVGAVSGFVSNFFFGQGPWTPWQMFALGITGLIAGVLFSKGIIRKTRLSLCIYGAFSAIFLYGGITNPASVILWQPNPTPGMIISSYAMGLPFDIVHAAASVFFLWFIGEPMLEKLDRVKLKYGILKL